MISLKLLKACFVSFGLFSCGCHRTYTLQSGVTCKYHIGETYSGCSDGYGHTGELNVKFRDVCEK